MKQLFYQLLRVSGYSGMAVLGPLLFVGVVYAHEDPPEAYHHSDVKRADLSLINGTNVNAAIAVSGTVTSSADGMGIPGVNIITKGTTLGTVTDVDGHYSLNVPNDDDILVFSSIGYV